MTPLWTMSTVLITGGTGTFGQAMTRALLRAGHRVRVLSRGEHRQAEMAATLDDDRVRYLLGDVRDAHRIALAMRGCDLVYHAAAIKRIEKAEYDPDEAVQTNILGTRNVIHAALHERCRVVFLSTDKACRPITHYGYTKAAAESYVLRANAYVGGPSLFTVMRYGNVANSQGSVLPLWRRLADRGEPLSLTDARMTRFWITIDEAVAFATWVADQPAGRVYVPRMPSFKLLDLAAALSSQPCRLVGIRGVEKLHEDIVAPSEPRVVNPWGRPMSSDQNDTWLSVTDLRREVARCGA